MAALPGANVPAASLLGEGWGAVAVRIPSGDGGRDWVLRLPRPESPWGLPDLEREARLLPFIARQPFDVAVPGEACRLIDTDGAALGVLHRLVPGTPLAQRAAPRGRARVDLCAQVGRFLSVLHAAPVAAAKRHGAREVDLWTEQYLPRIEATLAVVPEGTRRWLQREAEAFATTEWTAAVPRRLIHADISGDHLLLDEAGRLSGVIDFADAVISDPALDFAGVLNHLGWRDLERVLEHYEGDVDEGALRRVRFYIQVAPIYQVMDGYIAIGERERRRGIRRLAARAGMRGS